MDAFIAGAWRTPSRGEVLIGGAWKRLTRAEAYVGGRWRSVLTFVAPVSASVNPSAVEGTINPPSPRTRTVFSETATATPFGGQGPYTYAWAGMGVTVATPSQAATQFSALVPAESTVEGSASVTVTDAGGNTAVASVLITLNNYAAGTGPIA